jgi:hypothetical protein
MRIRRKFLQLTKRTYPYGSEGMLTTYLPPDSKMDEHGNYYLQIGDPTTMFTCHLDTACSYEKDVKHVFNRNMVGTNGSTILGADDKAGMTVVLYMISKKVTGLYYFFIGEEVGCVGSSGLSASPTPEMNKITKVVSFDRRGTDSVITHQMMGRCCSDEFAKELSSRFNLTRYGLKFSPDDTGVLTDSAQFTGIISECTNISVGYYREHTVHEEQDLDFLSRISRAAAEIDWESLPVKRDPSEPDDYDYFQYYRRTYKKDVTDVVIVKENDHNDSSFREYDSKFFTYILQKDGTAKKMYVSQTWITYETTLIFNWLKGSGYSPKEITWDGSSCWCSEGDKLDFIGTRNELIQFINTLSNVPFEHLRDSLVDNKALPF